VAYPECVANAFDDAKATSGVLKAGVEGWTELQAAARRIGHFDADARAVLTDAESAGALTVKNHIGDQLRDDELNVVGARMLFQHSSGGMARDSQVPRLSAQRELEQQTIFDSSLSRHHLGNYQ